MMAMPVRTIIVYADARICCGLISYILRLSACFIGFLHAIKRSDSILFDYLSISIPTSSGHEMVMTRTYDS
jgi:hypothetical protein